VVTALYRRYRPETFAELIGQSQVTDPLRTALRNDRVNHAYLFSGPRGCGKTTSARILARCLNCVEGPTDTPCGVCPSCIELSRDGGGSMDVVEIDAASHGGVEDARDLRERAIFAPARDRYKIFILDEAHMVTSNGFNALLKIVEEPPEHVKFIFATTEPEKVISTIRSRTHHYPFRLVPPAQMLEYVQQLSESEKVEVEAGVLPLVVRAGGGSVRDTLSLLDQLIAGSEGSSVEYNRAVALLGYTHGALLGEVVEAIGSRDASAAFASVDRVIQTGQDPRRFVEDLLERLRDLIVVSAMSSGSGGADAAAAVLRGIQHDELDRMSVQAARFGTAELSRAADVVNAALTEMTGATSPRLHLELMIARVLMPASDDSERGALVRVERLERRIGVAQAGETLQSSVAPPVAPAASVTPPHISAPPLREAPTDVISTPSAADVPVESTPAPAVAAAPSVVEPTAADAAPAEAAAAERVATQPAAAEPVATQPAATEPVAAQAQPVTIQQVKDSWPEILEAVQKAKRTAWMVVFTAKPLELRENDVLVLSFQSQNDVDALKQHSAPGEGIGDYLKKAVFDVLGFTPKLLARLEGARPPGPPAATAPSASAPSAAAPSAAAPSASSPSAAASVAATTIAPPAPVAARESVPTDLTPPEPTEPDIEPPVPTAVVSWETAVVTDSEPETKPAPAPARVAPPVVKAPEPVAAPKPVVKTAPAPVTSGNQRYGEAVVREILGASFIEEQIVAPRVQPREE
jgi:DNA polymerase-3 subunit gamma/tau